MAKNRASLQKIQRFVESLDYSPDELDRNFILLGRFLESQGRNSETVFWMLAMATVFKTAAAHKAKHPDVNKEELRDRLARKIPTPRDLISLGLIISGLEKERRAA